MGAGDDPGLPDDDPWQLERRDELALLALRDLLDRRGHLPNQVGDEDTIPVGIRVAPVGFRVILGLLASENYVSYSGLALIASAHGLALLATDPRMIRLFRAYSVARRAVMSTDDQDALARLGEKSNYRFQHAQAEHTTFPVRKTVHARLVELAMACGIPAARLSVIAILVSLLTLPNIRKYRDALEDEVAAFWRYIAHRERLLRLGP
jgi:hypothetical protein